MIMVKCFHNLFRLVSVSVILVFMAGMFLFSSFSLVVYADNHGEEQKEPTAFDAIENKKNEAGDAEGTDGDAVEADGNAESVTETDSDSEMMRENDPLTEGDSINVFSLLIKILFSLGLIILLIYGMVRFLAVRNRHFQKGSVFANLGGIALGQNKSLQLIKVGSSLYLVGVADQIQLIRHIDNPEEIEELMEMIRQQQQVQYPSLPKFLDLGRFRRENRGEEDRFESILEQKLSQLKQQRAQSTRNSIHSSEEERDNRE